MRTFPAGFQAELSRPGCNPYWLLVIVVGGATYYLSDTTRTIASLGVTAYGVVKSWGSMREGSGNGTLAGYNVSEYTVQILAGLPIATDGTTIDTLYEGGHLDEAQADIYLGLGGISAPPQLINPGYVRDFGTTTDTVLPMIIQDKTILLEKSYVGDKITSADWPQAAAADVGKVIPLPFGPVAKVPALALSGCLQTLLTVAATAAATSLTVADTSNVATGMVLLMESEQVIVTAVGAATITVTRGYNGTTAEAHAKGVTALQLTSQVYVLSGRPVTSMSKIWLRYGDDLYLDITAYTTRYTGQSGSELAGYEGMAVASISTTGMVSIMGIVQLVREDTITVSTGSHDHDAESSRNQIASNQGSTYGGSTYSAVTISPTYPAVGGTVIEQTNEYAFNYGGNSYPKNVYVNGNLIQSGYSTGANITWSGTTVGLPTIQVVATSGLNVTVTLVAAKRSVAYTSPTTTSPATGVARSGAVTLSGSSLTSYFGSGKLFGDLVADAGAFVEMANWILARYGLPDVTPLDVLEATSLSGLINEYQPALYWLNKLAFECGAWFMMPTGRPRFVSRRATSPVATISDCTTSDGLRSLTSTRTDLDDKVDVITVLYGRDWSRSKGTDAYAKATAPAGSGTRERPELFQFDFVTAEAVAVSLRDLYLDLQSSRRVLRTFGAWIDQACIESGDTVALGFLGSETGIVMPAESVPGNFEQADTVTITVLI